MLDTDWLSGCDHVLKISQSHSGSPRGVDRCFFEVKRLKRFYGLQASCLLQRF